MRKRKFHQYCEKEQCDVVTTKQLYIEIRATMGSPVGLNSNNDDEEYNGDRSQFRNHNIVECFFYLSVSIVVSFIHIFSQKCNLFCSTSYCIVMYE